MKLLLRFSGLLAMVLVLAACDMRTVIKKVTPEKADAVAREFIQDVARGELTKAEALLHPDARNTATTAGLQRIQDVFAVGPITNIEQIGINVYMGGGRKFTELPYEVKLAHGWSSGTVVVVEDGGKLSVRSANFTRNADSLERLNAFTFHGKTIIHFAFLVLCVVIPFFSLTMLVWCIRLRVRRRWLWAIFIALGFVTFRLNWGTGMVNITPLSFLLFGASAYKTALYSPWVISFAIPFGAIIFYFRRHALAKSAAVVK